MLLFISNYTSTTEIYTLSLHDALPICISPASKRDSNPFWVLACSPAFRWSRSEEHTSELQSRVDLVCRLLLDKKNHVHRSLEASECRLRSLKKLGGHVMLTHVDSTDSR